MAVSEQTPYIEYTANDTTTSFALEFDCDNQDHLIVLVDDVEPAVGSWSLTGGAVVFGTAPEDGKKITIQRNTPFSRNTDYQSYNNSFRPHSVNGDFDRVWRKIQELGFADWALRQYVDKKDNELKAFLLAEIQAQGVALDQLDDYYNYLMQRLAQIAVQGGWEASFIADASGKNQQEINNSVALSLLFDNFGVSNEIELKEYIGKQAIQAIIKTDGTDETATLRAYLLAAKTLKRPLLLPSGVIVFSDTIEIDFKAVISGFGRESTYLQFKNTTIGKPALRFKSGGGRGWYSDFTLRDETLFQSTGVEFTDSRSETNGPVWKNTFANIEILGFKESHTYTSADPLAGSTHAHCSENLWIQCRFSANQVTCVNRNCQAVNNVYLRCDFENSDASYYNGQTITDANFEFFRDEAGGGITLINPSIIGRGRWFGWKYPTGGTVLFGGSGQFKAENVRAEVRPTHYGCLIEELVHGVTGSLDMLIEINTASCVVFDANIDLMRFGGRVNALFNNVFPAYGAGRLFVRCYPTQGRSSNITTGAQSTIVLDNCGTVFYERETSSPYGTYSRNATPSIVFRNQHSASTNSSYSVDADGWLSLRYGGDIQQLPQSFGTAQAFSKLVYNLDWVSAGIGANSQIKVCMPKHGRPLKLFAYKHAVRLADNLSFNLYLVKDKANWTTPGTFNLVTDAIKVSDLGSTLNKAGYFEVPVNLLSAVLGNETMSGFSSWLEGRMLIEYVGSVAFAGFVGVDYI